MAPNTSSAMLGLLLSLLLLWGPAPASAKWQTLNGSPPIVIANGGLSGLYPDQTSTAYYEALYQSLPGVVLSCDLQLAQASIAAQAPIGAGICRTGLNLVTSTNINVLGPNFTTTHVLNGQNTTGYFAVDIPIDNLTAVAYGTQSNSQRSPAFDGVDQIATPGQVPNIILNTNQAPYATWWLNSENTRWIEANSNINASLYTILAVQQFFPGFVSVPEINLLKEIYAAPNTTFSKLIYKFLDTASVDASTGQSYSSLLRNLSYISTYANGILVPKSYIWPINPNTLYTSSPTTLVADAHKVGLEVYAYDFANDQLPGPSGVAYNYSYDPITEILNFIEKFNFSVDGFFTDFPVTASEAISCYSSNSRNSSAQNKAAIVKKPTIISHNGYSGKYPGATSLAYYGAIDAKVDYIDCIVQISKDSVLFCRPTVNLLDSTDISTNNAFLPYLASYPGFNGDAKGYYPFDLTWAQITTLRAIMYSPEQVSVPRDTNYDGQLGILTFSEFLAIAKNNSVGVLIDIQNAVYLRQNQNLLIVDSVVAALSLAGYSSIDKVIMQSEDSAALARLRDLNITYPLMFEAIYTKDMPSSITADDIVEIKKYASSVNFGARLVEPFDSNYFLSKPQLDVVAAAHAQNLTTYFTTQRNEFIALAFDLQADPSIELKSLINDGIDGLISDFPVTVQNYFVNQCLDNGNGLTSTVNFTIPLIVRGVVGNSTSLRGAPAPAAGYFPEIVVGESPLAGPNAPAPAPASAPHISMHFLLTAVSVFTYVLLVL